MIESDKLATFLDDFPDLSMEAKDVWSSVVPVFDTFCFCRRYMTHFNIQYTEQALQVSSPLIPVCSVLMMELK